MGRLKQEMIAIMDEAIEEGELYSDGTRFTRHSTIDLEWHEVGDFIFKLRDIYKLQGRDISEVNAYSISGVDPITEQVYGPREQGIEIKWREADADTNN